MKKYLIKTMLFSKIVEAENEKEAQYKGMLPCIYHGDIILWNIEEEKDYLEKNNLKKYKIKNNLYLLK